MDISVTHDNLSAKDFNPLPRKEGDTLSRALYFAQYANFNPLPRKEGDEQWETLFSGNSISIHSLVKRETTKMEKTDSPEGISIHSLVKRETVFCQRCCKKLVDFNPLPRKEGDLQSWHW